MKHVRNVVATLAVLMISFASNAGIIYQNVDDEIYNASSGYTIGLNNHSYSWAFTAGLSEYLDSMSFQLWNVGTNNIFDVELFADDNGTVGTMLESVIGATGAPNAGASIPLVNVDFTNATLLSAGTSYWVTISSDYVDSWLAWEITNTGVGTVVYGVDAEETPPTPAPAPAGLLLLALGIFGTVLKQRNRR